MERWIGTVAVVTGASSGIGAAISLRLANLGLIVVGLARRKHLIDELAGQVSGTGRIHGRQVDLSKSEEINTAFEWIEEEFGGIHILVNNAGLFFPGNITAFGDKPLNDESILLTIDVNFKALVICTRRAVENMKKKQCNGHIININSVSGHYTPRNLYSNVYPTTKHAVTAFTIAVINELAEYKSKIKVTSISPGIVLTELVSQFKSLPGIETHDVVNAVEYALSTPPNVNINELGIKVVGEGML